MTPLTIADIWAAVSLGDTQTQVFTILIAFVGINLGFLAYRFSRRAGIR